MWYFMYCMCTGFCAFDINYNIFLRLDVGHYLSGGSMGPWACLLLSGNRDVSLYGLWLFFPSLGHRVLLEQNSHFFLWCQYIGLLVKTGAYLVALQLVLNGDEDHQCFNLVVFLVLQFGQCFSLLFALTEPVWLVFHASLGSAWRKPSTSSVSSMTTRTVRWTARSFYDTSFLRSM